MQHRAVYLRRGFEDWINDGLPDRPILVPTRTGEAEVTIRWVMGQLHNCTDIMPDSLCARLEVPAGSTFAKGVRSLRS